MRILILILLMAGNCFAASGIRPSGATDIGAIVSTDSIPIDRANTTTPYKTTPQGIKNYVAQELSGIIAPATHVHPFANSSTASGGFMSPTDKVRVDALYDASVPNSKTEGAVGDGAWHSLASQGYTDYTQVQADFPYVTDSGTPTGNHIITNNAMLTTYGIDWVATKQCSNRAKSMNLLCEVNPGVYVFERTFDMTETGLIGQHISLSSKSTEGTPKAYITRGNGYTGLLITMNNASQIHNLTLYNPSTRYDGVKVTAGALGVTIRGCRFSNMDESIITDSLLIISPWQEYRSGLYVSNTSFNAVNYIVHLTGSCYNFLSFNDNYATNNNYAGGVHAHGFYIDPDVNPHVTISRSSLWHFKSYLYYNSSADYLDTPHVVIDNCTMYGLGGGYAHYNPLITAIFRSDGGTGWFHIINNQIEGTMDSNVPVILAGRIKKTIITSNSFYHMGDTSAVIQVTAGSVHSPMYIIVANNIKNATNGPASTNYVAQPPPNYAYFTVTGNAGQ